jgi:hypothetical protein
LRVVSGSCAIDWALTNAIKMHTIRGAARCELRGTSDELNLTTFARRTFRIRFI